MPLLRFDVTCGGVLASRPGSMWCIHSGLIFISSLFYQPFHQQIAEAECPQLYHGGARGRGYGAGRCGDGLDYRLRVRSVFLCPANSRCFGTICMSRSSLERAYGFHHSSRQFCSGVIPDRARKMHYLCKHTGTKHRSSEMPGPDNQTICCINYPEEATPKRAHKASK